MKREKREIRKFHVVLGSSCSDGKEMYKKAWSFFCRGMQTHFINVSFKENERTETQVFVKPHCNLCGQVSAQRVGSPNKA